MKKSIKLNDTVANKQRKGPSKKGKVVKIIDDVIEVKFYEGGYGVCSPDELELL